MLGFSNILFNSPCVYLLSAKLRPSKSILAFALLENFNHNGGAK